MALGGGGAYHEPMSGKVFISLVCGGLGVAGVGMRLISGHMDLDTGLWLVFSAAWLVRAYLYWRESNAQGS
jgi:hypothetical protein